jgi:hypothetical protein
MSNSYNGLHVNFPQVTLLSVGWAATCDSSLDAEVVLAFVAGFWRCGVCTFVITSYLDLLAPVGTRAECCRHYRIECSKLEWQWKLG